MNLVKQLRTWDEMPEYDSDSFHWLDLKTAEAADLIERQAAQIEMLRKMLEQVCGSYLLEHPDTNIDPFVEALSTTQDQALEQFAAKANRFISRRG